MSYDIYLCGDCLGPIWFPFGEKMHLGTGWYCWKEQQKGQDEGEEATDAVGEFIFSTDPKLLKNLVAKAIALYEARLKFKGSRKSYLVPFLQRQLRAGRSDVLHGFLRHLAKEPAEYAREVVREITLTPEWTRFARRAMRKRAAR